MNTIDDVLILNCQERIVMYKRELHAAHPDDSRRRSDLSERIHKEQIKLQERLSR